ncbi:ROK family protein [Dysgonomonas sp. 520]|uniref:ROK family protein n=1 Tax=Dysgonomonas sp. 520 TaxID=2302931 RepID=UPI0013D73451|nr:ROK family protein [Dysgonomonas sp. 520]NDW09643.1 ROK family protein [Dysgonomonas sp. 520]
MIIKYAIGIDLGGTSIKYSLICHNGEFALTGKLPSCANVSAQAVIGQLITAINICKQFAEENDMAIQGVGIGTPGIVDDSNRIIIGGAENIVGWENVFLSDILEKEINLPVTIGNDANLMGLGETYYGAGIGYKNIVFITVGTGIGGAVVIDGKLFNGFDNRGTELGHTPLIANGKPCMCGSVGCLEAYASTVALIERYIERAKEKNILLDNTPEINGEYIITKFKANDSIAVEVLEEHCRLLGHGIAGFVNIFSPQRIIIGGGLPESGDFYIEKVKKYASKYWLSACAENTEIVAAKLGNKAGTMGAGQLVLSGI